MPASADIHLLIARCIARPKGRHPLRALAVAITLIAAVSLAHAAGPYDGSQPLKCRIQHTYICSDPTICVRGTADTVMLPPVLVVDVPRKVVSGDASGRTARITAVAHGQGRMLLHGEEIQMSGTAWNVAVDETTGAFTAAVLSHAGGFLMFGTCTGP
jgi:hypothetical protein